MNQTIDEQLSALMDGELERDQTRFLLKRLQSDTDLPQRWTRYHVARLALRRQSADTLPAGFADAVMARLEAESSVSTAPRGAWLRWGAGGAIAASVAVAALVMTKPSNDPSVSPSLQPLRAVQQGTPANSAAIAVATPPMQEIRGPLLVPNAPIDTAPVSFGSDFSQPVATDPHLQSYLVRHYQATGMAGQSSFVPYVLLAAPQHEASVPNRPAEAGAQNR